MVKENDYNPFPQKECRKFLDNRKIVVCKDQRSPIKYVGLNKKMKLIAKFNVDNCLIKEGKRCDFLILVCKESAYFIETKGCEILKAAEQLNRSINQLHDYLKDYKKKTPASYLPVSRSRIYARPNSSNLSEK